jgi:hypothetical protein
VLEYISRPPGKPKNGYERTLLRADAPTLLAEAWMMAITHGALFHTGANLHIGDRGDATIAPHPGLAAGPNPEQVLANKSVGMRFPMTTPPGGGHPTRPSGIALPEGFFPLEFGKGLSATVQDG